MGAVNTTYTFTATDTITSSKMNNIIDQTTMTSDAIIGTTLEVASGKLKVRAGGITSNELASGSVTSASIVNGTIVDADINASAAIAGSKLAENSTNGSKIVDSSITAPKLDGAQTGSAPIFGVRAWGSFDGSTTPITPNGSGNVSSITRLAAASYRVTFTNAMPNENYAVSFGSIAVLQSNVQANATTSLTAKTTTNFDFSFASTSINPTLITFMVVG